MGDGEAKKSEPLFWKRTSSCDLRAVFNKKGEINQGAMKFFLSLSTARPRISSGHRGQTSSFALPSQVQRKQRQNYQNNQPCWWERYSHEFLGSKHLLLTQSCFYLKLWSQFGKETNPRSIEKNEARQSPRMPRPVRPRARENFRWAKRWSKKRKKTAYWFWDALGFWSVFGYSSGCCFCFWFGVWLVFGWQTISPMELVFFGWFHVP